MPNFFETPSKINEYLILPIQLPASGAGDLATHYLYLRRHEPKVPTKDDSRSLFSVNVPVDATEAHLRGLFSNIGGGRVERVVFEGEEKTEGVTSGVGAESRKRKRGEDLGAKEAAAVIKTWDREIGRSGATAVIVFVDSASREMSLKAVAKAVTKSKKKSGSGDGAVVWGEGISDGSKIPALGISRYLTHHNMRFPNKALLQQSIDTFMEAFAEKEAESQRALARRRQEPDEDGFITVVRGGRVAPARQEEALAVVERKKGKGEHKDFYRFQMREMRKERHQLLLAKFEQDKKKVAERKSQRKFRPL